MMLFNVEIMHPWWLILLPAPLLIYRLIPAYQTQLPVIKIPFFNQIISALNATPQKGASLLTPKWWQRSTLLISWVLIVSALTKPTILGEPETRLLEGRDIMVVLDLSASMGEQDFQQLDGEKTSRLDAAKQVLDEFVALRSGDRLGLILFGDAAFIQSPFTADHAAWLALLEQTDVAMAGQSTHLGDAIGLAIKSFEQRHDDQQEKVAIILTDGNDTGSFVNPVEAAKVASAKAIKMHVIAMGDPTTIGEQALDMDVIQLVANLTGGEAFKALNRDELLAAYQKINELEPHFYESQTYWPKQSLHAHLLAPALILYLIAFTLATLKGRFKHKTASQEVNNA